MPRKNSIFARIVVSTFRTEDVMRNVANVAHTSKRRNAPRTTTGKIEKECYSVSRTDYKRLNTSSHAKNGEKKNPHKVLVYRQRKKQKHREKTGYNPEGRTCGDCHADISDRGHRAKRCVPCSTPPARTCMVCHTDISDRGARAQFCSEECKQHDQQLKESKGYTKTCTRCHETKEHAEFGLHYNLRRSVCKICEVMSQSERYHNFTPGQRARRNDLRRERERRKKADLSPEQKSMLRTKTRYANRRSKYGFDFDEDRLHSEQEGKCAICRTPRSIEELELDHDHDTDKLRGLLCKNCNFKLLSRYVRFPPQCQDSPYLNAYLSKGKQQ